MWELLTFISVLDYMVEMLEIVCWNWLNTLQMYCKDIYPGVWQFCDGGTLDLLLEWKKIS